MPEFNVTRGSTQTYAYSNPYGPSGSPGMLSIGSMTAWPYPQITDGNNATTEQSYFGTDSICSSGCGSRKWTAYSVSLAAPMRISRISVTWTINFSGSGSGGLSQRNITQLQTAGGSLISVGGSATNRNSSTLLTESFVISDPPSDCIAIGVQFILDKPTSGTGGRTLYLADISGFVDSSPEPVKLALPGGVVEEYFIAVPPISVAPRVYEGSNVGSLIPTNVVGSTGKLRARVNGETYGFARELQ